MSSDKRKPWFPLHTADWRGDAGLRSVGFAARGLWADMLTLMHEATPYGHLVLNGKPLGPSGLAKLLGGKEREIAQLLEQIEAAGVFSRTEEGVIFSRRMVRDFAKAERDRQAGHGGGNPHLERGTVPKAERTRPYKRTDAPEKTRRIFAASNGLCHWCGTHLSWDTPGPNFFHIDHVVPIRDGGTNEESNLVAACATCNHARARKGWTHSDPNPPNGVGNGSDHNPRHQPDNKAKRPETRDQSKETPPPTRARAYANRSERSDPEPEPHRIPRDWWPDSEGIALAVSLGLHAGTTAEKFRDHYQASGALKADWQAQFRKWLREDAEHPRPPPPTGNAHAGNVRQFPQQARGKLDWTAKYAAPDEARECGT